MKNTTTFIDKAKLVHGNKYDYSLVEYTNCKLKIDIICPDHGIFKQSPDAHTNQKQGCSECKRVKSSSTLKEFLNKAKEVHGDKYDYSEVDYKNTTIKIDIICRDHGIFKQRPGKHISNKRGCPKCGGDRIKEFQINNYIGWSYADWQKAGENSIKFDSFKVYILRCWNEEEEFYKIGKTFTTIKNRFYGNKIPYKYEAVKIIKSKDAKYISKLEKRLHKNNIDNKYVPKNKFNGYQECYFKTLNINSIIEKAYEYERED